MTDSNPGVAAAGEVARRTVLVTMTLLAASVLVACLRSASWPGSLLLAAVLLVPLALPLPGIVRRRRRTYAWATFCLTPYFIYGTTEAIANPAARPAAAPILLSAMALFVALVAFLRITRPQAAPDQST